MEPEYDAWNEQPLDLVKKKLSVPELTLSAMVVNNLRSPKVAAQTPESQEEYYLNEEDGMFYSSSNKLATKGKYGKDEKPKKFVLKVPTIKQEPSDVESKPWSDVLSPEKALKYLSNCKIAPTSLANLVNIKKEEPKPKLDLKKKRDSKRKEPQSDKHEELSRFALQSPNLYSALCLNKARTESMSDLNHRSTTKQSLSETPPKDPAAMSAAYLEVFDKLMADYVKKLNAQGSLDNIESTVEGINLVLNNLAAYEQKLLSAMYMGSLLNPSFPNMYSSVPTINPFLTNPGLGSVFNPVLNPGFSLGLIPNSFLQSGVSPDLLGCQSSPLLSAAYQNLLSPERASSTPMSPPASSPASVTSSSNLTSTASMTSNRLGSQESLLRVKDFQQWRTSNDAQSSTPTSSLTSLATPTDLSSSNEESLSISASSSARSSSVSSSQNLTLSPLSSVGASPPLSSKSDSHSRSQLLNFTRYSLFIVFYFFNLIVFSIL